MKQTNAAALPGRRTYHFLLLLTFLSALAIRLYKLDAQSLWYDEGVTAIIAQRGLTELTRWTARDIQPPLYYYQMAGWGRLAGWSEWSLRFPSAFWGTLAIPLMAVLACHLTQQRLAGLLAALLTAFHPLLIYYSQEARMYTLLVAIGLVAGYLLARNLGYLDQAKQSQTGWRNWLFYGVIAAAAVYIHYFAFFLLLAFGLLFLVSAGGLPPRRLPRIRQIRWFLFANLLVLLFYLAWIATLFTRLAIDSSYWQGRMKVWEALQQIATSFTSGETMLEAAATRLLLPYALVTLLALVGLVQVSANGQTAWVRPLYFALIWLGVPVFCVLLLTGFVPKFNPRYVLLALPGLLLIWSCGLSHWLLAFFADQRGGADLAIVDCGQQPLAASKSAPLLFTQRLGQALSAFIAVGFLLFGFGASLQHWFTDPSFTKDQWRELSRYVREEQRQTEAIVLVSGHAWPIWDYYAPDLPAIRLPDLEILDVNAVVDFANSAPRLQAALAGKTGAWLVTWQDEVIDPTGVAPLQLALAGREQRVKAEFWHLGLRHFTDLNPAALRTTPPLDQRVDANFGNKLRLLGYAVAPNGDLLLTWQLGEQSGFENLGGLAPTIPDYQITLQTFSNGLLYAHPPDQRPSDYNYPVKFWRPQQQVLGRIAARTWAGASALPGTYQLHLGVYDPTGDLAGLDLVDTAGAPAGKRAIFTVMLPLATAAEVNGEPTQWPQVAPAVHLWLQTATTTVEPGQWLELELHWFFEHPPTQTEKFLWQWRRQTDNQVITTALLESGSSLPMQQWPTEQVLRQRIRVQTPLKTPPGPYWLELGAMESPEAGARIPLTLVATTRQFVAPPISYKVDEGFFYPDRLQPSGGVDAAQADFALVGLLEALPTTADAGSALTLTLVWQAHQAAGTPLASQNRTEVVNLAFTLQLLDTDGLPAPQVDLPLPGGNQNWLPGQVETQTVTLQIPHTPGEYRLIVAVYNPNIAGLPRLQTTQKRDFVELGRLRVTR